MVQIMRQSLFDWHPYARTRKNARAQAARDEALVSDAPALTPERLGDLLEPTPAALTREQIVDRILVLNPTASVDFLDSFTDEGLRAYFSRLQHAHRPRGRASVWTRPVGPRAIGCWVARD